MNPTLETYRCYLFIAYTETVMCYFISTIIEENFVWTETYERLCNFSFSLKLKTNPSFRCLPSIQTNHSSNNLSVSDFSLLILKKIKTKNH
jgi:hypothetical protein